MRTLRPIETQRSEPQMTRVTWPTVTSSISCTWLEYLSANKVLLILPDPVQASSALVRCWLSVPHCCQCWVNSHLHATKLFCITYLLCYIGVHLFIACLFFGTKGPFRAETTSHPGVWYILGTQLILTEGINEWRIEHLIEPLSHAEVPFIIPSHFKW